MKMKKAEVSAQVIKCVWLWSLSLISITLSLETEKAALVSGKGYMRI